MEAAAQCSTSKTTRGWGPYDDSKYFSILLSCVRMLVFVAGHRSLEKALPLPYATYTTTPAAAAAAERPR